jgi:hypothetical protein
LPFDEELARRVCEALSGRAAVEKKMMGGVVFMVCCGVDRSDLIVRVGPSNYPGALREPHVRPMDITGRPLKGFVLVGPNGHRSRAALEKWVMRGVDFAASLPSKRASRRAKPRSNPKKRS